ncbi:MAG: sigma-70 family RNA polymerase sigma factor [Clostridia bacterium]|nr:sigma-70 family RNA polymerase sigma factor [Clostridia bacterium]
MAERPKRRKYKDNPYTLKYVEEKNIYLVSFKDVKGHLQNVEVSKEIYLAFDRFELEDLSEMNEYDNHIEHSEIYENNLEVRAKDKPISLEDEVIQKTTFEELKKAIDLLPNIQKRRIKKYYFEEKNEIQIAKEENTTHQAVHKSLSNALMKLKEILKN